ncbi:unnamed protein product, partial [Phaeothamnion confervicola]
LRVLLKSAKGLPVADATGSSDPYCVLVPIRRDNTKVCGKATSSIRSKTVDPIWEQTFEFKGEDLQGVLITVVDHDYASADDVLGRVFCPLAEFGEWDRPNL